jgi:hypothetical protein
LNRVYRNIWPDAVTHYEEENGNFKALGLRMQMRPMWTNFFQYHTEELSRKNLTELEKEINDEADEWCGVEPVKHLSTKQLTEFFKHCHWHHR